MGEASGQMARGIALAAGHCRERGIEMDSSRDPNGTCLVGPRYTPLFTSLGQLEAKRTTLNPDLAGLLAHLLESAGISAGDTVAVGASGSFPGLLLATLAAVGALDAHPVTILSLGASSFGATRPDFHLLDLYGLLQLGGIVADAPAAVSLGGEDDMGSGFDEGVEEELRAAVAGAGLPLLEEPDLGANVARRMEIYGRPAAFVNIGGAEANLGVSPSVLEVPAGLVLPSPPGTPPAIPLSDPTLPLGSEDRVQRLTVDLPPPDQRGVLFEMLDRGVPTIHLLHIRGLALRYGLPWDPIPLPEPGSTALREEETALGWRFWLLTLAYLGTLAALAFTGRTRPPVHDPP
jgi:poly-gamma-glutamate system protein